MRRVARITALIFLAPLAPIALYLAAAATASRVPVNDDWREPDDGVTIFVETNGVHTGVIVPANAAGVDWRRRIQPGDAPRQETTPQWLGFGWGDRDFYLNTPTWAQFSLLRAISAATGQGTTLVHVDLLDDVRSSETVRPLRITPEQYRRLAAFVDGAFADRREVIRGYGAATCSTAREAIIARFGPAMFGQAKLCALRAFAQPCGARSMTASCDGFHDGGM